MGYSLVASGYCFTIVAGVYSKIVGLLQSFGMASESFRVFIEHAATSFPLRPVQVPHKIYILSKAF